MKKPVVDGTFANSSPAGIQPCRTTAGVLVAVNCQHGLSAGKGRHRTAQGDAGWRLALPQLWQHQLQLQV